jgi:flagellar motor component MotA
MLRGLLSVNAGDNPRIVRQKLDAYLPPKSREAKAPAATAQPQPGGAPVTAGR